MITNLTSICCKVLPAYPIVLKQCNGNHRRPSYMNKEGFSDHFQISLIIQSVWCYRI